MENGEQKTCQDPMHKGKPCGRPLYDGEKCICHSEKEDKDVKLFQQELDKIFEDQRAKYCDLTGFFFPKEGYRLPKEYKKDTFLTWAKFSGKAYFGSAKFSGRALFDGVKFKSTASFIDVQFSQAVYFIDTTFSELVSFYRTKFSGRAEFARTDFSDKVIFTEAMFTNETDFFLTSFSQDADFSRATFYGKVDFEAWFSGKVDFVESTFCGSIMFRATVFEKMVDFSRCEFRQGSVVLFDGEEREGKMFNAVVNLSSVTVFDQNNIMFRKVCLEKSRLLETNVSNVQFVDATWPTTGKVFKWLSRNAVYDELVPDLDWTEWTESDYRQENEDEPSKYQYSLIAQVYRRLQANYINNYRYAEAGDFHIGEQEMMRKAKGKVGQYLSTNNAYRIISHYGESFLLPLLWMLVVLLAVPAVLLYDGINLNPSLQNPAVIETVNYEWSWSPGDFLPANSDYWEAFVANFSLIAYSRSDIGKYLPESHTRFIVTIESLVVIALLAFFLLALRRKYKRKTF